MKAKVSLHNQAVLTEISLHTEIEIEKIHTKKTDM